MVHKNLEEEFQTVWKSHELKNVVHNVYAFSGEKDAQCLLLGSEKMSMNFLVHVLFFSIDSIDYERPKVTTKSVLVFSKSSTALAGQWTAGGVDR